MADVINSITGAKKVSLDEAMEAADASQEEEETEETAQPEESAVVEAKEEAAPEAAKEQPATEETKEAAPEQPAEEEEEIEPPSFWTKAEKAVFGQMPKEYQKLIASKDKQGRSYTDRLANELKSGYQKYKDFDQVFTPERQKSIMMEGINPVVATERLWGWHEKIQKEGATGLAQMAQAYGIPFEHVVKVATGEMPAGPSEIDLLRQKVSELESRGQQQVETFEQQQAERQLQAFANETDAQGIPLRPFFNELRPLIKQILPVVIQERPEGTEAEVLHEAWERALYADPNARNAVLQAQQNAQKEAQKQRVQKAKAAGSSLTGSSTSPVAPAKPKGLDAAFEAALQAHGG